MLRYYKLSFDEETTVVTSRIRYSTLLPCKLLVQNSLEAFTANQSSFYLSARLRSDRETTVTALKKTIANAKPSRRVKFML